MLRATEKFCLLGGPFISEGDDEMNMLMEPIRTGLGIAIQELRDARIAESRYLGMALALQDAQRQYGVPVLPLRVICGVEEPTRSVLGSPIGIFGKHNKGGLHITDDAGSRWQ